MSIETSATIPLKLDCFWVTRLSYPPFSAWVHFDRPWQESDGDVFRHLIRSGCRYLMMTGINSDEIHEISDDIAIAETKELVLTSSSSFGYQAALDFLDTRCPERPCSSRYLVVLSDSIMQEAGRLLEMRRLTEQ